MREVPCQGPGDRRHRPPDRPRVGSRRRHPPLQAPGHRTRPLRRPPRRPAHQRRRHRRQRGGRLLTLTLVCTGGPRRRCAQPKLRPHETRQLSPTHDTTKHAPRNSTHRQTHGRAGSPRAQAVLPSPSSASRLAATARPGRRLHRRDRLKRRAEVCGQCLIKGTRVAVRGISTTPSGPSRTSPQKAAAGSASKSSVTRSLTIDPAAAQEFRLLRLEFFRRDEALIAIMPFLDRSRIFCPGLPNAAKTLSTFAVVSH